MKGNENNLLTVNRNDFVTAFAFALDFLEIGMRENVTNHNKRVCLIALRVGEALGLDAPALFDLCACAMLHDNGVTYELYKIVSADGHEFFEARTEHCVQGEENLAGFPFLQNRANVIKYHHEAYDGSGFFGIRGDGIPLFAQIIAFADTLEISYRATKNAKEILAKVAKFKGTKFAPAICDAFFSVAGNESFWLLLDDMFIDGELKKRVPVYNMDLRLPEILPISAILRRVIDAKSPFTAAHSNGLSQKAEIMAGYYGFDDERKTKFVIAANLHDTGKLVVPNAILDKNGKLTPEEFAVVKTHTFYTRKVLETIGGFEDITEWASNHHEKLDGTGYPYGLPAEALPFESRLMACLDIYQALTEERPYREGLSHAQTIDIMTDMAEKNAISKEILSDVAGHFGKPLAA